jgi:hypothetical protein
MSFQNEARVPASQVRLGRLPAKSSPKALMLRSFLRKAVTVPKATNFWTKRAGFTDESWGNLDYGDCTIAKQANMFRRFERLEQRRTISIAPNEVIAKYQQMTLELYGGGDTGAYETDALDRSRRANTCLRDARGHALLIDAYTRVDAYDHDAVREAMFLSGGKGLAVCLNLPLAFASLNGRDEAWDIPTTQPLTGEWMAGSWGGHSMWAIDYNAFGIQLEHTWARPEQWLSWRAAAAYMDECHVVIDSKNAWKRILNMAKLAAAVDKVSSQPIMSDEQKAAA